MPERRSLRGRLGEYAGQWTGQNRLWFEPGTPARECSTSASLALEARGAFGSFRYTWEEGGATSPTFEYQHGLESAPG